MAEVKHRVPSVYDILHNFVAIVSLELSRYDILQNVVDVETGDAKGQTCRVTLVSFRWFVGSSVRLPVG